MKNHIRIAKASANIIQNDRYTWIPLYYSPEKDEVYMTEGKGRHLMTHLIRENTATEIMDTIERLKKI